MKYLFLTVFLVSNSVVPAFAQENKPATSPKASPETSASSERENLDRAVSAAEELIENRRKTAKNTPIHADALANLAAWRKKRIVFLKRQSSSSILKIEERPPTSREIIKADNDRAEAALREALGIYEKLVKGESLTAAALKIELTWFLNNPVGYLSNEAVKDLLEEMKKLYTEALATQEKLAGFDSDLTLNTVLQLADYHLLQMDFENALPFYERFLTISEKKHGQNHKSLVPALRGVGLILANTDREAESVGVAKRISSIAGKPEERFRANLDLTNRVVKSKKILPATIRLNSPIDGFGLTTIGRVHAMSSPVKFPNVSFKRIVVNVLIDENGDVTETKILGDTKKAEEVEQAARSTKFRPFVYQGTARKMRGSLSFSFVE